MRSTEGESPTWSVCQRGDGSAWIVDARHVIYIAIIGFLLIYSLYLTVMVSRMSNQIRHLISAVAILETRAKLQAGAACEPKGLRCANP